MSKITVLMFHHITPKITEHAVSPVTFKSQLIALKQAGYNFISINDLEAPHLNQTQKNTKNIAVTFDDGWLDNWIYAFPILKELNIPASLFIVSSWPKEGKIRNCIDTSYLEQINHEQAMQLVKAGQADQVIMRWQELENMQNSGLVSIHCHSHHHGDNWDDLNHDNQKIIQDILLSKQTIEAKLNIITKHFCWPRGRFTPDLFKQVKILGFDFQYSTIKGCNSLISCNNKIIRRLNVIEKPANELVKEVNLYQYPLMAGLLSTLHKISIIIRLKKSTSIGKIYKWIGI
jgi:peptidoglycan/xylan/chitin deacetylase (PgdA/CDA1 family)